MGVLQKGVVASQSGIGAQRVPKPQQCPRLRSGDHSTRAASKIAVSPCPRVTPRRLGQAPARLAPQAETRRL